VVTVSLLKVEINDAAARDLLMSAEVVGELMNEAEKIQAAAQANSGPGAEYEITEGRTPTRARVSIGTANFAARKAEGKDRALSRALGGTGLVAYTNKAGKTSMITKAQHANYSSRKTR